MIKVGYDGGHSLFTPGKETPDKEKEWSFNDKVARAFANELALYEGLASKRFDDPTGKRDVPLKERTDGANNWGANYYISFHHNANTAKWGNWTGVETHIYTNSNDKSIALANAIHPALVEAYGLKDRGIKKTNLHIVRETKMPAVLIEGGFMDSTIDIKKLRDDKVLENAGKLIAQAFAKFVGLKKVVSVGKVNQKRHSVRVFWFPTSNNSGLVELKKYLDSKKLNYKVSQNNGKYMLESFWYPQGSTGKYELEKWLQKKGFNYDVQLEK